MSKRLVLPVLSIFSLLLIVAAGQQPNPTTARDAAIEAFRKQVDTVFQAYRASNQPALDQAVKALSLPLPQEWMEENFATDGLPKITKYYAATLERIQKDASNCFDLQKRPLIEHFEVEHLEIPQLDPPPFVFSSQPIHPVLPEAFRVHFVHEGGGVSDWEVVMMMVGDSYRLAGNGRYPFWLRPIRITMGGNVQQARLIHEVRPMYPKGAKAAKTGGTVRLHVLIGPAGDVESVEVVSGDPELAIAAADAVRQWRYQQTLLNGKRVEVETFVEVVFSPTN